MGYKWKEVQKGGFYNRHEQKDVVEYKERFLEKMKELLSYFGEFSKEGLILSKKYSENCIVEKPNQWSIIMIIYNKSIFSVNDEC